MMDADANDQDEYVEWMPGEFPKAPMMIAGGMILRPDATHCFDELVADNASVHLEMMGDDTLWMSFGAQGRDDRVMLVVWAKKGKLHVKVEKDCRPHPEPPPSHQHMPR